jgi:hypothetical protein
MAEMLCHIFEHEVGCLGIVEGGTWLKKLEVASSVEEATSNTSSDF